MSDYYKSEPIFKFGVSFFYKIFLEGLYDGLFDKLERDLSKYNEELHKLDVQSLLNLFSNLENIESCLPLPIYLKEQILKSRIPGDQDILTVKSYESDRRRILETTEAIKQKVIRRLIDIDPNVQKNLLCLFNAEIQTTNISDNNQDKSSITSSIQGTKIENKIFSQIEKQDCLDFLIANYKGCKSKDIVPMLYAITDLGLVNKAEVFNNRNCLGTQFAETYSW